MSEGKLTKNNFTVENWAGFPEGLNSIITSYIVGCEGWRRLKQCETLRELLRKWKPSIITEVIGGCEYPERSAEMYKHGICNNKLKGDTVCLYVSNPPRVLLKLMNYNDKNQLICVWEQRLNMILTFKTLMNVYIIIVRIV